MATNFSLNFLFGNKQGEFRNKANKLKEQVNSHWNRKVAGTSQLSAKFWLNDQLKWTLSFCSFTLNDRSFSLVSQYIPGNPTLVVTLMLPVRKTNSKFVKFQLGGSGR